MIRSFHSDQVKANYFLEFVNQLTGSNISVKRNSRDLKYSMKSASFRFWDTFRPNREVNALQNVILIWISYQVKANYIQELVNQLTGSNISVKRDSRDLKYRIYVAWKVQRSLLRHFQAKYRSECLKGRDSNLYYLPL